MVHSLSSPTLYTFDQTAHHVNDGRVIDKVKSRAVALETQLGRPPRIGCLGLAFKPDVDDLRGLPLYTSLVNAIGRT